MLPEKNVTIIDTILNIIGSVETSLGKSVTDFNRSDFIVLFYELGCYSPNTYRNKKSIILSYLNQLYEKSLMNKDVYLRQKAIVTELRFEDLNVNTIYDKMYHKNFNGLNEILLNTVDLLCDGCIGTFDTLVACSYLAWAGIKLEESVVLNKHDVSVTESKIVCPTRVVFVNEERIMIFLRDYSHSNYYEKRAKGGIAKMNYKDSNFLLRTFKSPCVDVKSIHRIFSKFNSAADMSIKFKYDKIYWSGVFYRLHLKEKELGGLPPILDKKRVSDETKLFYEKMLQEPFNIKTTEAVRKYNEWKKCFNLE